MLLVMVEKHASLLVNGEQSLAFSDNTSSCFDRRHTMKKKGKYCCWLAEIAKTGSSFICVAGCKYYGLRWTTNDAVPPLRLCLHICIINVHDELFV